MKLATEERTRKQGETNRISLTRRYEHIEQTGSTSPANYHHSPAKNQKWYNRR